VSYTREEAKKVLAIARDYPRGCKTRESGVRAEMIKDLQWTMNRIINGADLREAIDCLNRTGYEGGA